MCLKVLRLELYSPRRKWTVTETLIFFKVVFLVFIALIPENSSLVETPLNHLKQQSFYVFNALKSYRWSEFFVEETWKSYSELNR